MVSEPN